MPVEAKQDVAVSAQAATPVTSLPWIPLDIHLSDFRVAYVGKKSASGQINFKVQGTLDNILDPAITSAVTFDITASAATSVAGNTQTPMRAIRVQVVSASASSNLSFRVTQAGT